ncbi:MAG: hypothetical protein SV760_08700, partial [Halobacteria archaeon]|nr:hypothetical protein [Halobacteria archaeon]
MYRVVGCSHCESVKIVEGNSETTTCNRCQKQIDMRSVRVIFQSDSLEEAKEARSLSMAKRNGFDYLADEMVENEVLDDSVAENIGDDIGGYSGKDVPQDEEAERRLGSSVGGARDAAENKLGDIGVDERMEGNGVDKEEVRDAGERKETREKTTQDSDP